ncbi:MAG: 2-oxoisovalerate dehydrogenase [Novosphingobium sp.]|nr:2-oxoisovalerate dehydrogenase [Novosphingobium sp.]
MSLHEDKLEIIFEVEEDPTGGYVACAIGEAIVTQAESLTELRQNVKDAVHCHFEGRGEAPRVIRLMFVRQELLSA